MTGGDGILLVDKPAGVTSYRVVSHVRQALLRAFPDLQPPRTRRGPGPRPPRFKCGHTGTLDPLATGLLVVVTGRGSRLAPFLSGQDKTYAATVRFGAETDTLDSDGVTTLSRPAPPTAADVTALLDGFRGPIHQVPPLISALKRDGKPLYARVRAGEQPAEPEARPVRIDRLEATASRWPDPVTGACELDLLVACSAGTYVRSLARDLGRAAGSAAHLAGLRRLTVGPFAVADAVGGVLERDGADLAGHLRPLAAALPGVPRLVLTAAEAAAVASGAQPQADWLGRIEGGAGVPGGGTLLRLVDETGGLVAVARLAADGPRLAAVLVAPPATEGSAACE